jgi:hypothetical protein
MFSGFQPKRGMKDGNINIVTHGGAKTGNDAVRQEPVQHQWVKKNVEPRKQFDAE